MIVKTSTASSSPRKGPPQLLSSLQPGLLVGQPASQRVHVNGVDMHRPYTHQAAPLLLCGSCPCTIRKAMSPNLNAFAASAKASRSPLDTSHCGRCQLTPWTDVAFITAKKTVQ